MRSRGHNITVFKPHVSKTRLCVYKRHFLGSIFSNPCSHVSKPYSHIFEFCAFENYILAPCSYIFEPYAFEPCAFELYVFELGSHIFESYVSASRSHAFKYHAFKRCVFEHHVFKSCIFKSFFRSYSFGPYFVDFLHFFDSDLTIPDPRL